MYGEVWYCLLFPAVGIMTISDFRHREISVLWLGLFSLIGFGSASLVYGWRDMLSNVAGNMLLLIYLTTGVIFYLMVKRKLRKQTVRFREYAGAYIGSGDVLFLFALTPFFPMKEFLIFLILSFAVTLVGWSIYVIAARRLTTIPLVSTLSICLCVYMTIKMIIK